MGDRCYLTLTILAEDEPKFTEALKRIKEFSYDGGLDDLFPEVTENGRLLEYAAYEANYGYYNIRLDLAKAGLVFSGHQGEGECYGSCDFAAIDGQYFEISDGFEMGPVVPINRDGTIDPGAIREAKEYFAADDRVQAYFADHPEKEEV